jgi:hypothetical protein
MQEKKKEEMAGSVIRQWLLVKPMRDKGLKDATDDIILDVSTIR